MKQYKDLEMTILSCLLIKPKLMEEIIVEDKHFIKHKSLWMFMKSFYKKFGNFDLTLMYSVAKNKYEYESYLNWMIDTFDGLNIYNFQNYQKQLIELFEEMKKDKWIIEEVYKVANDLFVRNITTSDFKEKVDNIYTSANEIFKNE